MYSISTRSSATSKSSGRSLSSVPDPSNPSTRVTERRSQPMSRVRKCGKGKGRTERVLHLSCDALDAHEGERDERDDKHHQPALRGDHDDHQEFRTSDRWPERGRIGTDHVVDEHQRETEEVERHALLEVHLKNGRQGSPNDSERKERMRRQKPSAGVVLHAIQKRRRD